VRGETRRPLIYNHAVLEAMDDQRRLSPRPSGRRVPPRPAGILEERR
jgi:hypothetical protein